jgi:hypothetical protein
LAKPEAQPSRAPTDTRDWKTQLFLLFKIGLSQAASKKQSKTSLEVGTFIADILFPDSLLTPKKDLSSIRAETRSIQVTSLILS